MNQEIPAYSVTICLGYPVDIEVIVTSFIIKKVAWHSQDCPKGCA